MNDTPKWQLWLLARLPRPLALMGIMLGKGAIAIFPIVATAITLAVSTAVWAYIGLWLVGSVDNLIDFWITIGFAGFGFFFPVICLWMYEEYRKLDRYTPRREKKTEDISE